MKRLTLLLLFISFTANGLELPFAKVFPIQISTITSGQGPMPIAVSDNGSRAVVTHLGSVYFVALNGQQPFFQMRVFTHQGRSNSVIDVGFSPSEKLFFILTQRDLTVFSSLDPRLKLFSHPYTDWLTHRAAVMLDDDQIAVGDGDSSQKSRVDVFSISKNKLVRSLQIPFQNFDPGTMARDPSGNFYLSNSIDFDMGKLQIASWRSDLTPRYAITSELAPSNAHSPTRFVSQGPIIVLCAAHLCQLRRVETGQELNLRTYAYTDPSGNPMMMKTSYFGESDEIIRSVGFLNSQDVFIVYESGKEDVWRMTQNSLNKFSTVNVFKKPDHLSCMDNAGTSQNFKTILMNTCGYSDTVPGLRESEQQFWIYQTRF